MNPYLTLATLIRESREIVKQDPHFTDYVIRELNQNYLPNHEVGIKGYDDAFLRLSVQFINIYADIYGMSRHPWAEHLNKRIENLGEFVSQLEHNFFAGDYEGCFRLIETIPKNFKTQLQIPWEDGEEGTDYVISNYFVNRLDEMKFTCVRLNKFKASEILENFHLNPNESKVVYLAIGINETIYNSLLKDQYFDQFKKIIDAMNEKYGLAPQKKGRLKEFFENYYVAKVFMEDPNYSAIIRSSINESFDSISTSINSAFEQFISGDFSKIDLQKVIIELGNSLETDNGEVKPYLLSFMLTCNELHSIATEFVST